MLGAIGVDSELSESGSWVLLAESWVGLNRQPCSAGSYGEAVVLAVGWRVVDEVVGCVLLGEDLVGCEAEIVARLVGREPADVGVFRLGEKDSGWNSPLVGVRAWWSGHVGGDCGQRMVSVAVVVVGVAVAGSW